MPRSNLELALTLAVLSAAGCAYQPARFRDQPPLTSAGDTRPIAVPRRTPFVEAFYLSDVFLRRPLVDALDAERFPFARDVSSLDEVPPSAWFAPLPLEPRAFERAYAVDGPPVAPVRVEGGSNPKRLFDARGREYRIVTDHRGLPEVDTAAQLIASRLVRAIGYLTPEAWLVDPKDLGLVGVGGASAPLWVAVRWPLGANLGPTDMTYTRSDDPNDRIAHRDRRTLRALGVVAAWLDLRELGPTRLVDAYVGAPGRGHVRHFVVGLHDALGAAALAPSHSHETAVGPVRGSTVENLFTLGLRRPAERRANPARTLRVLSPVVNTHYELGHPYEPVNRLLASDGYWIAKRLEQIPSALLKESVRAAEFSAPELERHVLHALEARRRKLVSYWFAQVTPCEVESVHGRTLTFTDRALRARLESPAITRYEVRFLGEDGRELSPPRRLRTQTHQLVLEAPELASDYIVVRLTAERRGTRVPRAFEAHFKAEGGELRLLGVRH
ncbi:MAG: hypothetical protein IPI67_10250 [Myxococcales bacterium]|nr:hypothetical protein [Myxococcales bacterium]